MDVSAMIDAFTPLLHGLADFFIDGMPQPESNLELHDIENPSSEGPEPTTEGMTNEKKKSSLNLMYWWSSIFHGMFIILLLTSCSVKTMTPTPKTLDIIIRPVAVVLWFLSACLFVIVAKIYQRSNADPWDYKRGRSVIALYYVLSPLPVLFMLILILLPTYAKVGATIIATAVALFFYMSSVLIRGCKVPSFQVSDDQSSAKPATVPIKDGKDEESPNLVKTDESDKIHKLISLLDEEYARTEKSIIFVERKATCEEVVKALLDQGLKASAFHGGRSLSQRERDLRDFIRGLTNILVATDALSKNLKATGVAHVVNFDFPNVPEEYERRIGITWRTTSFFTDADMSHVLKMMTVQPENTGEDTGNTEASAAYKVATRRRSHGQEV